MGMNYYWRPGAEDPLAPYRSVHIGKRSAGWSFSFQGFRFEGRPGPHTFEVVPGLSLEVAVSAPSLNVASWADWKALLSRSGEIRDEYDEGVTLADFIALVEVETHPVTGRFNGRPLLRHRDELERESPRDFDSEREWVDSCGYSFSLTAFS